MSRLPRVWGTSAEKALGRLFTPEEGRRMARETVQRQVAHQRKVRYLRERVIDRLATWCAVRGAPAAPRLGGTLSLTPRAQRPVAKAQRPQVSEDLQSLMTWLSSGPPVNVEIIDNE